MTGDKLVCNIYIVKVIASLKENARDTNFFTKFFTNCWCVEWLLINKIVMLLVGPDENK